MSLERPFVKADQEEVGSLVSRFNKIGRAEDTYGSNKAECVT